MTLYPTPSLPRTPWIHLCSLQLVRLRPDVRPETLTLVATLLFDEVCELSPAEAATLEVKDWNKADLMKASQRRNRR